MKTAREHADRLAEEIAEVAAHIDAATHRLLTKIREFDDREGWKAHGATGCAQWLSWRIGLSMGAAREKVRVARALADLPRTDAALASGRLSYCKARAITRVATPENEAELLGMAQRMSGGRLEKLCREVRGALDVENGGEVSPDRRYVTCRDNGDGLLKIEAVLTPDEAAFVMKVTAEASGVREDTGEINRADGLVTVIEAYARGETPERSPVELVVTSSRNALTSERSGYHPSRDVSAEDAERETSPAREAAARDGRDGNRAGARPPAESDAPLEGGASAEMSSVPRPIADAHGTPVSAETARRLGCDAGVVNVTVDAHGTPLDVGRKTRTIPPALRRALGLRDGGCVFPGCPNRRYVDGHHVVHWADGGETRADNLLLLCRRHHGLVHEGGFSIEKHPDGFVFLDPDGERVPEAGERPRVSAETLLTRPELLGLDPRPGARKSEPPPGGEPRDHDACIETLLSLR